MENQEKELREQYKTLTGKSAPGNIGVAALEIKVKDLLAEAAKNPSGNDQNVGANQEPPAAENKEGAKAEEVKFSEEELNLISDFKEGKILVISKTAEVEEALKKLFSDEFTLIAVTDLNGLKEAAENPEVKELLSKLELGTHRVISEEDLKKLTEGFVTPEILNTLSTEFNKPELTQEEKAQKLHEERVLKYGENYVAAKGNAGLVIFSEITWEKMSLADRKLWKREVPTPDEIKHLVKN